MKKANKSSSAGIKDDSSTNVDSSQVCQPIVKHSVMRCPSKLILENRTDLPMVDFLRLAQEVVSMGRISNDDKQYCYLTSFTINGQEYHIVSDLNEKSDKLTFYKRPS